MGSPTELISQANALLQSSQADAALKLLQPNLQKYADDVPFLQIFGETLLENNDVESAYEVLSKACQSDPNADLGVEKFFYLGQIIGGEDGLSLLDIGLVKLNSQLELIGNNQGTEDPALVELSKLYKTQYSLIKYIVKKMNQGIFAKIEIWMTDLCMEEEAEAKCNELIDFSLSLDSENPEALSLLSSIRISQQRNDEAKEALMKSWSIFNDKKQTLEESANKIREGEEVDTDDTDAFEVGLEYIELVQPLLTLAKFAIELELYDVGIEISSSIQDINESGLESYYYEALANLFNAKKVSHTKNQGQVEDYRDIEIAQLKTSSEEEIKTHLKEAKSALTQAYKIINSEGAENDGEVVEQVEELLKELGGPSMSELLPQRGGDEEGWEDEIHSDDEA